MQHAVGVQLRFKRLGIFFRIKIFTRNNIIKSIIFKTFNYDCTILYRLNEKLYMKKEKRMCKM